MTSFGSPSGQVLYLVVCGATHRPRHPVTDAHKIAVGMADNMATGLVCEALGRGVPITMEPSVGDGFAPHPAFPDHITRLTEAGVRFRWRTERHNPLET